MTQPTVGASEAVVNVAPGDVSHVCAACRTGHPNGKDDDPRHVITGIPGAVQMATLPGGQQVPVQVPEDRAYHFDCHAAMGCDHCAAMLKAHGGSVKGKAASLNPPDDLIDIEPYEFEQRGDVLVRQQTKAAARKQREAEHREGGIDFIKADEAFALHADHAASVAAQEG